MERRWYRILCSVAAAVAVVVVVVGLVAYRGRGPADGRAAFEAEWNKPGDLEPDAPHPLLAAPGLPDPRLYPPVPLAKVAAKDGWKRPRCLVRGTVTYAKKEDDGDRHFVVEAGGARVVCEIIPELAVAAGVPRVGQAVTVWGIPRWDNEHKWVELHPVIGWKGD